VLVSAFVVVVRGFHLQVVEGEAWSERAVGQHRQRQVLPAPRGSIYDRNGVPLAVSREAYRIAVAPRELRDPRATAARLQSVLGLSASAARRAVDERRRWVVLPGRYDAVARQALGSEPGIHFELVSERIYPHGSLAVELLGRVDGEGRALGGLELALDSLLRGRPGRAVGRRDGRGRVVPGSLLVVEDPVPGHDVYLTLDHELQEIADEALRDAIERTGSQGGDLIMTDPRTGEILAAASVRVGGRATWYGLTEPYEPGSTIKPFLVAALLAEGRAALGDSIYAEEGRYVQDGRTITDEQGYGWIALRDALRYSSNIAMAKVAGRLDPGQQYVYLRDFGFGTPTGIRYPSESSGMLRRPEHWSRYSQASLAIGYEIAVTPLQMVLAYGALANGGVLMEPRLIREVRSRSGRVVDRFEPRALRRVIPESVAREVSAVLVEVVEAGTGREAGLGTFRVAGKTGTAKQVRGGRYEAGSYTASFAGFFPADDPQLAFLVRLDRPRGTYYGGAAAAPVTRATLAAALAARSTALDRRAVASLAAAPGTGEADGAPDGGEVRSVARVSRPADAGLEPASPRAPDAGPDAAERAARTPGPYTFVVGGSPAPEETAPVPGSMRVPDVRGRPVRDAVRDVHARGFRVIVEGEGVVVGTDPAVGSSASPGAVVRVLARRASR